MNSDSNQMMMANGPGMGRPMSLSPGISGNFDPDIVPPPILSNDKHGLHLEMNHPIKPHPASAQMRPGMTKRKKLKKPSKKRLKNTQNAISHHTTTKKTHSLFVSGPYHHRSCPTPTDISDLRLSVNPSTNEPTPTPHQLQHQHQHQPPII